MTHLRDLQSIKLEKPSLVTIGVFDGIHKGHQTLLKSFVNSAHAEGYNAVVLTFYPHPDIVIHQLEGRYYLMTPEQRARFLLNMGVDYVITHPFNQDVREIRAAEFVNQLREYLNMCSLWVGEDFAMGYQREGNVEFLRSEGEAKGFEVVTIDLIGYGNNDEVINSSQIRELLLAGEVEKVREWLGYGYTVSGIVVKGEQRGRTIGFPTANIDVWHEQIIPKNGVYAGWATLNGEKFMAVTNVGTRPTFEGQGITVEAHLLDFDQDIYGEELSFSFDKRLRDEKKFNGIEELVSQINADREAGRVWLSAQQERST